MEQPHYSSRLVLQRGVASTGRGKENKIMLDFVMLGTEPMFVAHPLDVWEVMSSFLDPNGVITKDVKIVNTADMSSARQYSQSM